MAKRKPDERVLRARKAIVAGVVLLAAGVVGYGLLYSTETLSGEFREGEHYRVVDSGTERLPGAPITVTEFFSYGCIHCRNFDPMLAEWQATLPDDVRFERSPVAFSPEWALLGRAYYALDRTGALDENHDRLFSAIHDRNTRFRSAEAIADFVAGHGVDRATFLRALKSPAVRRAMAHATERMRAFGITSIPTLMVADKYVLDMGSVSRRRSLELVEHLVQKERHAGAE